MIKVSTFKLLKLDLLLFKKKIISNFYRKRCKLAVVRYATKFFLTIKIKLSKRF